MANLQPVPPRRVYDWTENSLFSLFITSFIADTTDTISNF